MCHPDPLIYFSVLLLDLDVISMTVTQMGVKHGKGITNKKTISDFN